MINYDKLRNELNNTLTHSTSEYNLRVALGKAIDGLDALLAELATRDAKQHPDYDGDRAVELLSEISGKLDTLIDIGKYT